jgi:putative membrane protein
MNPGLKLSAMHKTLLHWALSALAIGIVSQIVPGFIVTGAAAALIAAVVIGFINATLGFFLKVVTFPLTVMTLGIFWFVINAAMIELAANLIPGFVIENFVAAFWGAIALSVVNTLLKGLFLPLEI